MVIIKKVLFYGCILSLSFFLFSCKEVATFDITENFREKNPIDNVKLISSSGSISIKGWSKDFIEIQSTRVIRSNVAADLNFLSVDFSRQDQKLIIEGNVPSRIDGDIDFVIYVPYKLVSVSIFAEEGRIFIDDYYGDLVVQVDRGSFDGLFKGKLLRFDSDTARLTLMVDTVFSSDLVISNRRGRSNISVRKIKTGSFMDFKGEDGEMNLFISKDIPYSFISRNSNVTSEYNLTIGNIRIIPNKYLYAPAENNLSTFSIFINNEKGRVVVNERIF